MFHEVVLCYLERLLHTFTDGYARNNDDELVPSIVFVELEHRFDVDIGLSGTSFHLDIQRYMPETCVQRFGSLQIIYILQPDDVIKHHFGGNGDRMVGICKRIIPYV